MRTFHDLSVCASWIAFAPELALACALARLASTFPAEEGLLELVFWHRLEEGKALPPLSGTFPSEGWGIAVLSDEATNSPCRLVHVASPLVLRMLVRPEQLFGDVQGSHSLDAALVKYGITNG